MLLFANDLRAIVLHVYNGRKKQWPSSLILQHLISLNIGWA